MILRDNFPDFYKKTMLPNIVMVMKDERARRPKEWTRIFFQDTDERSGVWVSGFTGLGLFKQIREGEIITYDSPVQKYKKYFEHLKFGLGVRVTEEMVEDDQFALIKRNTISLARSEMETLEIQHASLFNNGFSAGDYALPDGQALFSATHPIQKTGGSQSNLMTAADLDVTSLQLALTAYEMQLDDSGHRVRIPAPRVVVHPDNRFALNEILHSRMRPDTANNAINSIGYAEDGMPEGLVWHYLTDTDAWYLAGEPSQTGARTWWRKKPYTKYAINEEAEYAMTHRRYRESHGFAHWQGFVGNAGA